jgi:hypothetical protein
MRSLGAPIDANIIEDVTDVLGFLARELVRQLCLDGLALGRRTRLASPPKPSSVPEMPPPPVPSKRARPVDAASSPLKFEAEPAGSTSSPLKRPRLSLQPSSSAITPTADDPPSAFPTPRTLSYLADPEGPLPLNDGPFALRAPSPPPPPVADVAAPSPAAVPTVSTVKRAPLGVREVDDALHGVQDAQHRPRCTGLRNFRRGWNMGRMRYV